MSCTISAGFGLQCKDGIGGIKKIYLNAQSLFAGELTIDAPTEMITASSSAETLENIFGFGGSAASLVSVPTAPYSLATSPAIP